MQDPEWIIQLAKFDHKELFTGVKKIFVETYLENIREGMTLEDALRKAEVIAQSFLLFP